MDLRLGYHGGNCCGIKTIKGFGEPDNVEPALSAINPTQKDIYGHEVSSTDRFFHLAAPEETTLKRLDRYIEFVKEHRPKHLIEVTLAEGNWFHQVTKWGPLLRRRGFKCVAKAKNSNSGNIVHVFYKVIGA